MIAAARAKVAKVSAQARFRVGHGYSGEFGRQFNQTPPMVKAVTIHPATQSPVAKAIKLTELNLFMVAICATQ